jgi:hypothetical protein
MKKQFIIKYCLGLSLILTVVGLYAQDTIPIQSLPVVTVSATRKVIPEKVWKNFRSYFARAENPHWYMANKDYLVKFMTDENLNHALFTKRGNLIYHISYGYENNLPDDIRNLVRRYYLDCTITKAIKVEDADRLVWLINLIDGKNYVLVRVEGGDMEEVEKLDKSS